MKGAVILPRFFMSRFTDNYKILLHRIAHKYDLQLIYTDEPEISSSWDIVITHAIPHHNFLSYPIKAFLGMPKHIKLIGWPRDLQTYDARQKDIADLMFERYDKILQFADWKFKKDFSDFYDKAIYFPQFVPKRRYEQLSFNENPEDVCLISGSISHQYPLRLYYVNNQHRYDSEVFNKVVWQQGPKTDPNAPVGDDYARFLNRYPCSLTDGSIYRMALAKHVEICAAGCLLICDQTEDLDKMGMKANKHYVAIDFDTLYPTIEKTLSEPEKFIEMRKEARTFCLENHTDENRFKQLTEIIDNL